MNRFDNINNTNDLFEAYIKECGNAKLGENSVTEAVNLIFADYKERYEQLNKAELST